MDKQSKNTRTLDIYVRLCEGKTINKAAEALKFGVDQRSIQRDIDDIRAFLMDRSAEAGTEGKQVVYDREKKGYVMEGCEGALMSNSEILAVSKILLESRAFTRKEIGVILDKLIAGCVPQKNMKLVTDLISNEKYHYVELHRSSHIKDRLWELGNEIKQCNLLEITYEKQNASGKLVRRLVQPVALLFSEYYFYLNAYIVHPDEKGRHVRKYEYPTVFRVDRIHSCRETGEKFRIAYATRFEEGEFRKRVQFMYPGELIHLKFRYTGNSVEAILDRLPTAKIIQEEEDGYILETEVFGKGILMWLLSQGSSVEVLRPESLRKEMRQLLMEMLQRYEV